jgi:ZIP family zinc transporter
MNRGTGIMMTAAQSTFWLGCLASLLAGAGTVVGAAIVLGIRRPTARTEDGLLSAAAGIMLAASFFSLLLPALDFAQAQLGNRSLAVVTVASGLLLGAAAIFVVHRTVPHEHFVAGREGPDISTLKRVWLFIIAITLHNFPEGMAVGVGFAGTAERNATSLAIGIGVQNIPEGLAVAGSMLAVGYGRLTAFWVGCLTGLVEPIGGALGSVAVWLATPLLPWMLGFAAGAMLFVISDEIIPETHRRGFENLATFSLLGGFTAMMLLDAALTGS